MTAVKHSNVMFAFDEWECYQTSYKWHHDIQQNVVQHNDTLHYGTKNDST